MVIMKVNLIVNKEKIPLKPFVIKVFNNIITRLVETLDRPEVEIKSIEISIEK